MCYPDAQGFDRDCVFRKILSLRSKFHLKKQKNPPLGGVWIKQKSAKG